MTFQFVAAERQRVLRLSKATGGIGRPGRAATVARADKLARQFEAALRAAFKTGMAQVLTRAKLTRLAAAIKAGRAAAAAAVLPKASVKHPGGFAPLATALKAALRRAVGRASRAELARLKAVAKADDAVNPYAVRWIDQHTAKFVTDISDATHDSIRSLVRQSFTDGLTVDELADLLQPVLSLSARDAQAVDRRMQDLMGEGLSASAAAEQAADYADDLLSARAETIARTETIQAANQGLMASWDDAVDQGLLPDDAKREWVASPQDSADPDNPCAVCVELDGQKVGMDEPFESSYYDDVYAPPVHPRCRCTLVLGDYTPDRNAESDDVDDR